MPLSPFDRAHPGYEGLIDAARTRLGDDATWEAAREEGRAMDPEEAATPPTDDAAFSLSAREAEVLALVAEGLTNAGVAKRLYLSPHTVNRHQRSVYRKLGVSSRAAAAKEASERGLI